MSGIFPELPLLEWIPQLVKQCLNRGTSSVLRKFKQQLAETSQLSQLQLS